MVNKFIKETISSLNKKLFNEKDNLFNLHYNLKTKKVNILRTTFVEAHCAHCLFELGYKKQAKKIIISLIKSKLYDKKTGLFRFSFKKGKIVNSDKNGCSNLLMVRNLAEFGLKKEAKKIMINYKKRVFNESKGLYGRSTRDKKLFVAQTNLWAVKALESIGRIQEARDLISAIVKTFYSSEKGLIISSSSTQKKKYSYKFIFCDDNFLFCYVAKKYYPTICKKIISSMLDSVLLDKKIKLFNRSLRLNDSSLNTEKSVYKNAICLLGLKEMSNPYSKLLGKSLKEKLYNKKERLFWDCFCDSNLLACWALYQ